MLGSISEQVFHIFDHSQGERFSSSNPELLTIISSDFHVSCFPIIRDLPNPNQISLGLIVNFDNLF